MLIHILNFNITWFEKIFRQLILYLLMKMTVFAYLFANITRMLFSSSISSSSSSSSFSSYYYSILGSNFTFLLKYKKLTAMSDVNLFILNVFYLFVSTPWQTKMHQVCDLLRQLLLPSTE